MLIEETKHISDDFKNTLWEATKKEVFALIKDAEVSNYEQTMIEDFYVRPLYWSKLNYFVGTMNIHNDIAIDDILKDNKLSEDEQKLFLSLLAKKVNVTTTDNVNVDAKNIYNKLFYTSDFITPDISELKKMPEIHNVFVNGHTVTNCQDYQVLEENIIGMFVEEQIRTVFPVIKILNYPMTKKNIQAYNSINTDIFNNNEIKVILKNNLKTETLNVDIDEDNPIVYEYNKTIIDLKIEDIDEDLIQVNYEESDIGFFKRKLTMHFYGPAKGKVTISYVDDIAAEKLIEIYQKTNGYKTIIEHQKPCKVSLFLNHDNEEDIKFIKDSFKDVTDYNNFVHIFKSKIFPYLFNKNNTIIEMYADIYLSPFLYKRVSFNMNGIPFYESRILKLIPEKELIMSIEDVKQKKQTKICL